ncbi:MAG: 5-bromo-4-chloroindolyl phosphate hydrolysis family protein [Oscillospiraceae bacterium]|jgi:hypothetical protein|nr:5-bromo-4-chloroindolyl phosphate hydrolysis family protein [Oscillospiraceae bacterium]
MKTIRKKSPIPFLIAGLMALMYGMTKQIYLFHHYVMLALLAFAAYWFCRIFWKDRIVEIEAAPDTGDDSANQLIRDARESLARVRAANQAIADPAISRTIDSIESGARELLKRIEEKPPLAGQLRTFLRYYLPTTVKILDTRAALEPGKSIASKEAKETRERTERMLKLIDKAMINQVGALEKNRYLDVQVEMDVLEGMLKSNGMIQ